MRRPAAITAGLCILALVALLFVAVVKRTQLAFTLGVAAALPVVTLQPGEEVCQTPISVPADGGFDRVALALGTYHQPGPEVAVQVRTQDHRLLKQGTLAAGYPDIAQQQQHTVKVGDVPAGSQIEVCVQNRGARKVAVYGNPDAATQPSTALYKGAPTGTDLSLIFQRSPRSMASLVGAMFNRASLFKTGWAGAWTFWLLAALVLFAVPVLLVRAVSGLRA